MHILPAVSAHDTPCGSPATLPAATVGAGGEK